MSKGMDETGAENDIWRPIGLSQKNMEHDPPSPVPRPRAGAWPAVLTAVFWESSRRPRSRVGQGRERHGAEWVYVASEAKRA